MSRGLLDEIVAEALGDEELRRNLHEAMLRAAMRLYGGQLRTVYFPKSMSLAMRRDRAETIRAAYDGTNEAALAKQHGLTVVRVRQIVRGLRPVRPAQGARGKSAG